MIVNGPHCAGCIMQHQGQRFVYFDGMDTSGILVVGDSPWHEEVRLGRPFAGPSGRLLDSQLNRAGIDRKSVIVTNSRMCKAPYLGWDGKHPDSAIATAHCRPHLDDLIERIKPKVILTLGAVAMARVIGVTDLDNRQAYIHDTPYGIPAIPTYHPSHILQGNHKLTQAMFFAIMRAKEVAQSGGQWGRTPVDYLIDPDEMLARCYLFDGWKEWHEAISPRQRTGIREGGASAPHEPSVTRETHGLLHITEVASYPDAAKLAQSVPPDSILSEISSISSDALWAMIRQDKQLLRWTTRPPAAGFVPRIPLLVIDLETPNSHKLTEEDAEDDPSYTIIRIGLSVAPNTAITVPWTEPYIRLVQEAVASAAVVIVWNGDGFDLPRMAANGITWQGEIHDAMWGWHFLQTDMLKSLGFVSPFYTDLPAWKHLSGSDLPYYTCCDADAEMRCYLGIRADIERMGKWPRYVRHVIRMMEILRRPHVGRIRIDLAKQAVLKQRLIEEREIALSKLQSMVPDKVKKLEIKKAPKKDLHTYTKVETPCMCRMTPAEQGSLLPEDFLGNDMTDDKELK